MIFGLLLFRIQEICWLWLIAGLFQFFLSLILVLAFGQGIIAFLSQLFLFLRLNFFLGFAFLELQSGLGKLGLIRVFLFQLRLNFLLFGLNHCGLGLIRCLIAGCFPGLGLIL